MVCFMTRFSLLTVFQFGMQIYNLNLPFVFLLSLHEYSKPSKTPQLSLNYIILFIVAKCLPLLNRSKTLDRFETLESGCGLFVLFAYIHNKYIYLHRASNNNNLKSLHYCLRLSNIWGITANRINFKRYLASFTFE